MAKLKISFPHMGKYHIPIKLLLQELVDDNAEVFAPPPITKKTIELGTKYSPDFVCIPFKYNLGNFIEALDLGANMLVQTGGGCRMGYYGEVQEQILKDLGYDFKMIMATQNNLSAKGLYKIFKNINPKLTLAKTIKIFTNIVRMVYAIDAIETFIRRNVGFEKNAGEMEHIEKHFLAEIAKSRDIIKTNNIYKKHIKRLQSISLNKPEKPLKVGIIGELYILMEPFSNYFIEKELAKFGIAVERFITASYLLFSPKHNDNKIIKQADGYVKYHIGADGPDSVAKSVYLAKNGYDGIIHLKPFGCTPEVNSMPICNKISQDYKIPILYFSFDSQTSETGVKTRLEAFFDMLCMQKGRTVV